MAPSGSGRLHFGLTTVFTSAILCSVFFTIVVIVVVVVTAVAQPDKHQTCKHTRTRHLICLPPICLPACLFAYTSLANEFKFVCAENKWQVVEQTLYYKAKLESQQPTARRPVAALANLNRKCWFCRRLGSSAPPKLQPLELLPFVGVCFQVRGTECLLRRKPKLASLRFQ